MTESSKQSATSHAATNPLLEFLVCIERLHSGGVFDLTDSPQSYMENVKRLTRDTRMAVAITPDSMLQTTPSETRRNDLELALLARAQFEGNAEGALHEMEFRVRKFLNAAPHVGAAPSMEEPQQGCLPGNPGASGQTAAGSSAPSAIARKGFGAELTGLINRYSCENESNTPDFILAAYLGACLDAFDAATVERERWHGREPSAPTTGEAK